MRNKKAKKIYDKMRYKKRKLIKVIEEMQKHKNIYNNKDRNKISNYTKKDIEELYKKAVYDKDKEAQKTLSRLGEEYKGSIKKIETKYINNLQEDLKKNIYGTRTSKLRVASKRDMQNFDALMNGLTTEQKAEFLNSTKYYGARRYQKPPAESETFNIQVEQDGASYIVQDLIKYYEDNGIAIPNDIQLQEVISESRMKANETRRKNKK